jgi:hypothetical protein
MHQLFTGHRLRVFLHQLRRVPQRLPILDQVLRRQRVVVGHDVLVVGQRVHFLDELVLFQESRDLADRFERIRRDHIRIPVPRLQPDEQVLRVAEVLLERAVVLQDRIARAEPHFGGVLEAEVLQPLHQEAHQQHAERDHQPAMADDDLRPGIDEPIGLLIEPGISR